MENKTVYFHKEKGHGKQMRPKDHLPSSGLEHSGRVELKVTDRTVQTKRRRAWREHKGEVQSQTGLPSTLLEAALPNKWTVDP